MNEICETCEGDGVLITQSEIDYGYRLDNFGLHYWDDPEFEKCKSCNGTSQVLKTSPKISYCKERVWSSGDMESCGKKAHNLELCREHFNKHKEDLELHKQELIEELDKTNERLKNMGLTRFRLGG